MSGEDPAHPANLDITTNSMQVGDLGPDLCESAGTGSTDGDRFCFNRSANFFAPRR